MPERPVVPSDERVVIGVDFGTLSGRALVVRVSDGAELGSATHDYPHGVLDRALSYLLAHYVLLSESSRRHHMPQGSGPERRRRLLRSTFALTSPYRCSDLRGCPWPSSLACADIRTPARGGGTPGSSGAPGEAAGRRVAVDEHQLGAGQLGEVDEVLGGQRGREHRVVRPAGGQPGLGRGARSGPRLPHGAGDRAASAAARPAGHDLDLVGHQAEPVAEVGQCRGRPPAPGAASKTSRTGSSRPPMPSGWISSDGWSGGDRRADLEHVRAEDLLLARDQVVGVVLHERGAAGQPVGDRP